MARISWDIMGNSFCIMNLVGKIINGGDPVTRYGDFTKKKWGFSSRTPFGYRQHGICREAFEDGGILKSMVISGT